MNRHTASFTSRLCFLIPIFSVIFYGGLANAITPGSKPTFAILGPLFINSPQEFNDFDAALTEAKNIGVEAVAIDVWWGVIQPTSAGSFDWSYYDNVFGRIKAAGLKIIPILSFHKCGGGPGDTCKGGLPIPIPSWMFNLAPDMKYKSGKGNIHDDAVAVWATTDSNVLAAYKNFFQTFATHFSGMAGDFAEVNVGLGPTGELRYPSYNLDEWNFSNNSRGVFQFYSQRAEDDFRQWALSHFGGLAGVNKRWGFTLSNQSEIRVPQNHDQFITNRNYENTQYGRDLIDWYNTSLVEHGARLLVAAHQGLAATMPSVPLGMKIPGVHWQMQNTATPRIAEITAGLVQTTKDLRPEPEARRDAFGYEAIMDMIADIKATTGRDVILHFTAAEMDNDPGTCQPPTNTSMAESLVFWISHGAADRNITHKAENALGCVGDPDGGCDDRSWQHITNVFNFAPYSGITFLRLSRLPDNFGCVPWNSQDLQRYDAFIQAFKNKRMVIVHVSEWEPCLFQSDGCNYNVLTWNNGKPAPAPFGLHYEEPQFKGGQVCRQWWTGVVANVPVGFNFTFNHSTGSNTVLEGQPGQFERTYDPNLHGNEIFALGRQSPSVFTTRPQCP